MLILFCFQQMAQVKATEVNSAQQEEEREQGQAVNSKRRQLDDKEKLSVNPWTSVAVNGRRGTLAKISNK